MSFRKELGKSPSSQAPAGSITDLRTSIHWIFTSPARSSSHRHSSRSAPFTPFSCVMGVIVDPSCLSRSVCADNPSTWSSSQPSPGCLAPTRTPESFLFGTDNPSRPKHTLLKGSGFKRGCGPPGKKKSFGYRQALLRILPMMNDLKPK